MKISQLTQIPQVSRDIKFPISIAGQNMHVTAGQLLDLMSSAITEFQEVDTTPDPVIADGSTNAVLPIVFHKPTGHFYARLRQSLEVSGVTSVTTTLYTDWGTRNLYYSSGVTIRTDCLFIAADGRLYRHNGSGMVSAGLTEELARQIGLNTPIEVSSEEVMEAMIANGNVVEGQLYFVAEEES